MDLRPGLERDTNAGRQIAIACLDRPLSAQCVKVDIAPSTSFHFAWPSCCTGRKSESSSHLALIER